ncbi:MAG TPA: D-aminoacyl-tRNA deacylase [Candidatus Limnocylindrales bacterium]|jgi:D-tyrosyl-tRNA(Tyr) deacylase|nr:D-aminoacyl-tRNA deacylase [Candidatus Limnocylindrales bacterium]
MRALLQRVTSASVRVDGDAVASIERGVLILLGVGHADDEATTSALARRVAELRFFRDDDGRTNRSILDVGGAALVVSQFTLFADTSRGRRPGFTSAAPPELADRLYRRFADELRGAGVSDVQTGSFGTEMAVELVNDGPFTLWLDTERPG